MNEINKRTLDLLEKLKKLIKLIKEIDNRFFFVVMGGIAVDGYVGKFTREHSDVDMIIFRDGLEKAEGVLEDLGYKHKRYTHPKESDFEYKMQTGDKNHLFSFQIADVVEKDKFEISFYRNSHVIFPLSYFKPPYWLELEGLKFPAVSKEMLIKLKEDEKDFYEALKRRDPDKYEKKRKQKHLNLINDLKLLRK